MSDNSIYSINSSFDSAIYWFMHYIDNKKFWTKEKLIFYKQVGNLLWGWVWLAESLENISQNADNYALQKIASGILEMIRSWKSLSFAMTRYSQYFSSTDVTIIKSGETTWNLVSVMLSLAKEHENLQKTKNDFISAMIYPIVLFVWAIVAVFVLFIFVLPEIFSIADSFPDVKLPFVTIVLQHIADFMISYWTYLLLWFVFWFLLFSILLSTRTGAKFFINLVIEVPLIGKIVQQYFLVRYARYQKMMLSSWLDYITSTKLVKGILDLPTYDIVFDKMIARVTSWGKLYEWMIWFENFIPPTAISFVKVWEETWSVSDSFNNIIGMYDDDLKANISSLSKVIEPIMMVIVWAIVVVVALWVFGVISTLMTGIQTW